MISRGCETFGCTPSQLLKEDWATVRGVMEVRSYAHAYAVVKAPDSDEDALERAGVNAVMSEAVFKNIERAMARADLSRAPKLLGQKVPNERGEKTAEDDVGRQEPSADEEADAKE